MAEWMAKMRSIAQLLNRILTEPIERFGGLITEYQMQNHDPITQPSFTRCKIF